MVNRQDLKRKLKASDRRRRRRSAAATPSSEQAAACVAREQTQSTTVDVSGLIVGAILDFADSSRRETRDAAVVAAIRGCLTASSPSGEQSARLHERINAIGQQPGVDMRSFRSALGTLMELAKEHQDPKNSSAFLRYLALLTG